MLETAIAGERVALLPERALWWPREATLFVADAHFGKAAAFRAHGVPVPRGTTAETLAGLDRLLARHRIERLAFLGDFLHARTGRTPDTLAGLATWRERHSRVAMLLVRGNHDRHAGDPPPGLGIECVAAPHPMAPFALCHEPADAEDAYALAGHLHPAFIVRGRARESVRLPCFVLGEHCAILPAFGSFTGTHPVRTGPGDRVFVIAEDVVLPVPLSSAP